MGWPVMHSRSPALHGYWLKEHGLKGAYVPLAVKPDGLRAALKALPGLLFSGCNLTIPHKVAAMDIVDEVDAKARRIGAISCVTVRPDGSLLGTNNDWYGWLESLHQEHPTWRADAGPAVVVGAGGAARAVLEGLIGDGCREIRIVNRTRARADTLAAMFGPAVSVHPWERRTDVLDGAATLVNTTSQGMVGQPPLDLALDPLAKSALVSDVIYIPGVTPLLAAAKARGNPTVNGLGMLLHQARPAWTSWGWGSPVVTPAMRAAIEATL
jgi:shikimate dehydrogenase